MEGTRVGAVSSIARGNRTGRILGFAWVTREAARPDASLEVMILGTPRPARVLGEAAYDPLNLRPRS